MKLARISNYMPISKEHKTGEKLNYNIHFSSLLVLCSYKEENILAKCKITSPQNNYFLRSETLNGRPDLRRM